jgi:hypothetical protein
MDFSVERTRVLRSVGSNLLITPWLDWRRFASCGIRERRKKDDMDGKLI